jgi:hypothetical protein
MRNHGRGCIMSPSWLEYISIKSEITAASGIDGALVHLCFDLVDETECRIIKRHYEIT